ncbi:MAG: hypothetical protein RLZZ500_2640 [Bacteroidota bacterium]|jgi:hypothetical protein
MKNHIALIILFIFNISNASIHKDLLINEKYGNVKVFLQTGFKYSDIEKIKIIGNLSEKICANLSFKDTLFIEYINDYVDIYSEDIYKFENNNTSYQFMAGLDRMYNAKSTNNGLSIRINANRIDIINVLKLVEYSITNRNKLSDKLNPIKLKNRFDDNEKVFFIDAISKQLLNEIFESESSIVNQVIKNKIDIHKEDFFGIESYWQNNQFVFEYKLHDSPKKLLFTTNDYYYCLMVNANCALVFKDKNNFYLIDAGETDNTKLIYIESGNYQPYSFIAKFEEKIVLFNSSKDFNILLMDKRQIISKF